MPIAVFLLILANLLFLAFTQGFFGNSASTTPPPRPVAPEQLRVVGRGDTPPAPPASAKENSGNDKDSSENKAAAEAKAPAPAQPPERDSEAPAKAAPAKASGTKAEPKPAEAKASAKPEVCLAWNGLSVAEADRLTGLFKDRPLKLTRRSQPAEVSQWWVFIPPLPSKADVDRKAGELKQMGISEFFIVQESGANHFAISLGVFSSENGAKDHLENLRAQGVRSAKVGPRAGKGEVVSLQARGDQDAIGAAKGSAAKILPKVQSGSCG
ncbi:hypothetical protein OTERR_04720 [Oryzomicrobium terrae]|uniref:SPOR domain-containing protein n=1 Tax=Oryzomicrobium terrae TaxID=1735038 RepID=A0A5C1E6M9_9RHOO|nr:SPOR domain-containing protein [Oryzomicrobium terrae]QEL63948.1 hypothetical protein OTERR_04720 [Oryzomicrobium terrae]